MTEKEYTRVDRQPEQDGRPTAAYNEIARALIGRWRDLAMDIDKLGGHQEAAAYRHCAFELELLLR